jgi:ABC-type nitrate/sulfonate/bicarbonate transport system substrate-binding protein
MRGAHLFLVTVLAFALACSGSSPPREAAPPAPAGVAAAGTTAAGQGAPAASPPQAPTKIRAAYAVVTGAVTPLWLALDHGLWLRHGLEVDLSLISGTPTSMAALLAGEAQFVQTAGDSALSVQAKEPDVTAILNTSVASAHRMIVTPEIGRVDDLKGKRMGVFTLGDGNYALISKALLKYGFNPDRDVTWTPVGGGNMGGLAAGLAAGAIDGALLTPPSDLPALRAGMKVLFELQDLDLPSAGLPVFTMRRTLDQQRAVAEAYAAGIIDGVRMFKSDPAAGKDALARWAGLSDPEAIEHTYEAYRGRRMSDRPFLDVSQTRQVLEILAVDQPDLRQVPLERVMDNSVLETLDQRGLLPPP